MVDIIPAILTNSVTDLTSKVGVINDASYEEGFSVRKIQIDIVDGVFKENRTIDPSNIIGLDTDLAIDFHLMVKEPVNWVEKCANAGADRIIGQIEMMTSQAEFLEKVQLTSLYVGLALDAETPVSELDPLVLNNLDVILLTTDISKKDEAVKKVLEKINELDEIRIRDATPFKICVDVGDIGGSGGIHFGGADEIAVGSALFNGNFIENVNKWKTTLTTEK